MMRLDRLLEGVLTSTQNLGFRAKVRKHLYPSFNKWVCYPDVAGVFLKEFSFTCPKLGINSKAWPFSICVLFYSIGNTVYFNTVKVLTSGHLT